PVGDAAGGGGSAASPLASACSDCHRGGCAERRRNRSRPVVQRAIGAAVGRRHARRTRDCIRAAPLADGRTLACQAMVGELTQVAVMQPESGHWAVLTHNRGMGYVSELSWSADGTRIYYDRVADRPFGVYTVPTLG